MEDDLEIIRTHFRENLADIGVELDQVLFDNAPAKEVDHKRPWARFKIRPGDGDSQGLAGAYRRVRLGLITFDLFTPKGEGVTDAYSTAAKFESHFADWRSLVGGGHLRCFVGTYREIPDESFFHIYVSVRYESIKRVMR